MASAASALAARAQASGRAPPPYFLAAGSMEIATASAKVVRTRSATLIALGDGHGQPDQGGGLCMDAFHPIPLLENGAEIHCGTTRAPSPLPST